MRGRIFRLLLLRLLRRLLWRLHERALLLFLCKLITRRLIAHVFHLGCDRIVRLLPGLLLTAEHLSKPALKLRVGGAGAPEILPELAERHLLWCRHPEVRERSPIQRRVAAWSWELE